MRSSHFRAAAKVQRAALRAVVVVLGCEMQSEGSFSKHSIYPLRRGAHWCDAMRGNYDTAKSKFVV